MRLQPFDLDLPATVSVWAPTPSDVRSWCARETAPVPAEVVAGWSHPGAARGT
ncbi:MAG: hypothetical protein M3386_00710 [Actinomycetota bacterium]|nr:hypothetical protein [Geodermatophilaceae bacterium]MDQ3591412.1 hypothetical protein [Actinomycetota bacterium]